MKQLPPAVMVVMAKSHIPEDSHSMQLGGPTHSDIRIKPWMLCDTVNTRVFPLSNLFTNIFKLTRTNTNTFCICRHNNALIIPGGKVT